MINPSDTELKLKGWKGLLESKLKAIDRHGVVSKNTLLNLRKLLEGIVDSGDNADEFLKRESKGLITMVNTYMSDKNAVERNDLVGRLNCLINHIDELMGI